MPDPGRMKRHDPVIQTCTMNSQDADSYQPNSSALFPDDAAILSLPSDIQPQQCLYFHGIRICLEMTWLGYQRLLGSLWAATQNPSERLYRILGFADAWSIVDSVHRLRGLLDQLPGVKKKRSLGFRRFREETAAVEDFRHFIQHLRNEVPDLAAGQLAVMGTLSWCVLRDPAGGELSVCSCTPGPRFRESRVALQNPIGRPFGGPVDYVALQLGERRLDLSELVFITRHLGAQLEQSLQGQTAEVEKVGYDVLVECRMRRRPSNNPMQTEPAVPADNE